MSKLVSKIVVLILGALVLVGCAKEGDTSNWERPRMAGEVLNGVAIQSGTGSDKKVVIANTDCMKNLAENADTTPVTKDLIISKCAMSTKAVSGDSAAEVSPTGRARLFYSANVELRGYYYLPYYINYNYTPNDYGSSANDICKFIFGVSCKKASNWANTYFGYDYTNNYQTYNQSYQPGCYSYLQYNYSNYGYGYSGYNYSNYNSSYSSPYSSGLSTNSFYYNPSTWNNSWYSCYNVYY